MYGRKASKRFQNGYMCAESVLLSICEAIDYNSPVVPAIATAFCSGVSRTKGACGALQGGILAISLVHGRDTTDQLPDNCYTLVQQLNNMFQNKYTTINCYELTGCDLSQIQGQTKFKEEGVKQKICLQLVEDVTDYTIELLKNSLRK